MFQTSNILYAFRVAKGSEILAFENSTGTDDKRQSELQTQKMEEREEGTGTIRGDYDPPLSETHQGDDH